MIRTVAARLPLARRLYEARQERVRGHDLFLGESSDTEWLTGVRRLANDPGFDTQPGVALTGCLVGDEGPVFVAAHSQWTLEAGAAMAEWNVIEADVGSDGVDDLREAAAAAGWQRGRPIHVGPATQFRQVELLREAFPDRELRSAWPVLEPLRACKDEAEVEALRHVGQQTAAAIRTACAGLRPGVGRRDLLDAITEEILATGLDGVEYGPDLWAVGRKVAVDWTTPETQRANPPLTPPCSVSIDVGASYRGYRSDIGRTVYIGEPPPASVHALAAIREARTAAAPLLRDGTPAAIVDKTAREVIARTGFAAGFWIPAGHGIGLELHEPPTLGSGVQRPLRSGNVVTLEIAVWHDGVAGAFAEDMVVVRHEGPEWLTNDGADPIVVG